MLLNGKLPCAQSRLASCRDPQAPRRLVVANTATLDTATSTEKAVVSGLEYLPEAARARATDRKANKNEKIKVQKCGSNMWTEVHDLARLIREGKTKWEDLSLDDTDIRLKWAGMFHRGKRTPTKFMMRLKVGQGAALYVLGLCFWRACAGICLLQAYCMVVLFGLHSCGMMLTGRI